MNESRALADLEWSINSPGLLDHRWADPSSLPAVDRSQVDRDHLARFLAERPDRKTGRYFESLVLYYLQHVRKHEIVAQGRPIVAGGRTIGELDFLYRDETGSLVHLEVAVKFYLHLGGKSADGYQYVGPNPADTFELKRRKLIDHQVPLSQTHCPEVERRWAMVKGCIYDHGRNRNRIGVAPGMNVDHRRGTWIRAAELHTLHSLGEQRWQILQKPYWLTADPQADGWSADQLIDRAETHFSESNFPLHCLGQTASGTERPSVGDSARLFIVSDDWPGTRPRPSTASSSQR